MINHGVSEALMTDAVNVGREFFSLPAAEKAKFVDQDAQHGCMVNTTSGIFRHG